jgi:hypothetical protein
MAGDQESIPPTEFRFQLPQQRRELVAGGFEHSGRSDFSG